MFSNRKKSKKRRSNRRPLKCESLEGRRLLAVVWSNRGSDANDSDGFSSHFGESAEIARGTVDAAISNWNDVIKSFNYADASLNDTYDITIEMGTLGAGVAADADVDNFDASGKPTRGTITVGTGTNWELDATPQDNLEFTDLTTPFWASDPTKAGTPGKDLLQSIQHELGHALGINIGRGSAARPLAEATGLIDPNDNDQTDQLILVTADSGLQVTMVAGHFYEGPDVQYQGSNLPVTTFDLMNSGRTVPDASVRRLITDLDAKFLRDIYGYSVQMPSTLNSFHAELGQETDELVVRGLDTGDFIALRAIGSDTRVDVNRTREQFDSDSINSTTVLAGDGNDLIRINPELSGRLVIDGGDGNDLLQFEDAVDAFFETESLQSDSGILKTSNGLTIEFSGIERFDFPRPDAGGNYSVAEGGQVALSGSFTAPPTPQEFDLTWSRVLNDPGIPSESSISNASVSTEAPSESVVDDTIAWDLDGDGIFGEIGDAALYGDELGEDVTFDASSINGSANGTVLPVEFRVTDDDGNVVTNRSQVVVNNFAPQLNSLTVSSTLITEGDSLTLRGTFSDPGLTDAHVVLVTWGDGQVTRLNLNSGERAFLVDHTYADPGNPTIAVRVLDSDGGSTSPKTIDVEVNAKPIANPDRVATAEDVIVNIDVLANDGDPDGDTVSVVAAKADNGTVRIEDDGTLSYRPNLNFTGVDTILYRISDGRGGVTESTVTVRVLSPGQQLLAIRQDVISLRDAGELTKGQAGSLLKKVEPKGSIKATFNSLKSFIQQVQEFVDLGVLEQEDGLRLIGRVRDIRTSLFVR